MKAILTNILSDSLNECPRDDIKLSAGEVPVMLYLGNAEYHFIAIAPRSTLVWSGSIWKGPI